ncbi:MAG: DUF262 domain-containing protein, partial [Myxococcota bacterium]
MTAASSSDNPPRLLRRPRAEARSVEDLLDDMAAGLIRIPRFQRPLRWQHDDVDLLFDSMYSGYPIGTLLFWRRPAQPEQLQLGGMSIDAPARQDALWVVDGQQRLDSLFGVLGATKVPEHGKYSLFFDLADGRFRRCTPRGRPGQTWLPLANVVDSAKLLDWLHDRGSALGRDETSRAMDLSKRIREYSIPTYTVDSDDDEPLRTIFDRMNSTGVRLDKADVFNALHYTGEGHAGIRTIAE